MQDFLLDVWNKCIAKNIEDLDKEKDIVQRIACAESRQELAELREQRHQACETAYISYRTSRVAQAEYYAFDCAIED